MPQVILSSGGTSHTVAPPAEALAGPLRILKRPSRSTSSTSSSNSVPTAESIANGKSLAEREADYQAARDRIFAGSSSSPSPKPSAEKQAGQGNDDVNKSGQTQQVVRAPRGPDAPGANGEAARGFGRKKGKVAGATQSQSKPTSTGSSTEDGVASNP